MALGKILLIFILFVSFVSFRAEAESDQKKANNGCQKWCENQKDDDGQRYIGGKCAGGRVINPYGDNQLVGCASNGCDCEKRSGDFVDGVNENVVDENGSEISS